MPDRQLISGAPQAEDLPFEAGLRPRRLAEFTGQAKLKENLRIYIQAAQQRKEPLEGRIKGTGGHPQCSY